MANTLNLGTNGNWGVKDGSLLAYNDENNNFKPLPFDFTRASSATRVNQQGLIETVASGVPRIDYTDANGALLLEPQRTNVLLQSNQFDTTWSLSSAINLTSEKVGIGGSADAWLLKKTDAASRYINQSITLSSSTYSYSVFAKKESGNWLYVRLADSGGSLASTSYFDLENGVVGSTSADSLSIQNYGNGWYRCEVKFTHSIGNVRMYPAVSDGSPSGGGGLEGIYIQYAQLEQGSYATSYIPTSGSAVTRVADSCSQTDINTSIINSSYPFSMYAESTYVGGNSHVLSFSKKSVSNNYYVITINTNEVKLDARANGASEFIESGVTLVDGQKFKVAVTMENATSGKISVNGNAVVSKTNFVSQSVNSEINDLLLGQLRTASDTGDRLPVSDVKLYNTALTDEELIALTT